jgi:hypothetical protein
VAIGWQQMLQNGPALWFNISRIISAYIVS